MTVEDRLLMLDVFFGLRVELAHDGEHLILRGPPDALSVASPMVMLLKAEIMEHLHNLHSRTDSSGAAS
jgi:hypothetical protein